MPYIPPAPGSNALITLENIRDYLHLPDAQVTNDQLLCDLIDGVSEHFNSYLDRVLVSATYTDALIDGTGSKFLYVPNYPVTTITSITETDCMEISTLVASTAYSIDGDSPWIVRDHGFWPYGIKNIKITYVAGYSTIPHDVQMACTKQVAYEFKQSNQGLLGVSAVTYPDGSINKIAVGEFLEDVKAVLGRYRRMTL
jgi:hypothetical protein